MTPLLAGTAGGAITPAWPVFMECYPERAEPVRETLDPLEARALVLDHGGRRAALVAVDVTGLEAESAARIQAAAAASGVPAGDILLMASHTHAAPAVTRFKAVPIDAAYLAWLEATLAGLVVAAAGRLRPVTLGVGEGTADFNVNRRRRTPQGMRLLANPGGLVDRRVRVLRLDPAAADGAPVTPRGTLGGRPLPQTDPLAVLFSYACHPTIVGGDLYRWSGDYPGAARRLIEGAYGGETAALFLPGCSGNLRPHLLAPEGDGPEGRFREGSAHERLVLGRRLGSAVVGAAERVVGEPVASLASGRREVFLPYGPAPPGGGGAGGETVAVHVLRLGRHWLVATPGETFLEIGLSVERGLAELGLADPAAGDLTLCLSYANGYVGYLASASAVGEGGYEPGSFPEYQRPAPFGPGVEAALVGAALEVAQELGAGER